MSLSLTRLIVIIVIIEHAGKQCWRKVLHLEEPAEMRPVSGGE